MSANAEGDKAAIRRELREAVRRMSHGQRSADSALIRQRLVEHPLWAAARSVLFFAPIGSEPDLWPLVPPALVEGKTVLLLRSSAREDWYEAGVIRDLGGDLVAGRFGIPEPAAHCPVFNLKQLDLALVPGIGFTLDGGRLGRGKGYYDRLLAEVPGVKCGVAFDCQIVTRLPMEPHDVRLNCILTPTRWHPVVRQARS
jgi:5-formyltetrahydrofolate cyclo-ligase